MKDNAPQPAAGTAHARSGLLANAPWAAVTLLMVVAILNMVDRLLPAILAEPIKHDLGLSDTFLGVLNGVGFLTIYAIAAIPIARVADKGHYGAVISAALALWSGMTALATAVTAGWQLAITRAGVAIGEAGSMPTAHAYISRNFSPAQRPKAMAVLLLGNPLGAALGVMGGGLLGQAIGWRHTFLLMGVIGLVLAPIVLLSIGKGQPLPPRTAHVDAGELIRHLRKPTVIALLIASICIGIGGNASAAFSFAFLMRVHGMSLASIGMQFGLLNAVVGVLALIAVSWLGAQLARRDARWSLRTVALLFMATTPVAAAAWMVPDARASMILILFGTTMGTAYQPLVIAALHSLVPAAMRAQASAVQLFCGSVAGGLGPLFAGMISDALTPTLGVKAIGWALLIQPAMFAFAGVVFALATITLRRDLLEETAAEKGTHAPPQAKAATEVSTARST